MQKFQLTIPKPCHEDWYKMTPNEQGRHCSLCAKTVIDLSKMTNNEIFEFFDKKAGGAEVCGRILTQKLNTEISVQSAPVVPMQSASLKWPYAAAAMSLLMLRPEISAAQKKPTESTPLKETDGLSQAKLVDIEVGNVLQKSAWYPAPLSHVFVQDENGNPIPYASVICLPEGKGIAADSVGRVVLGKKHSIKEIKVTAVGYEDTTVSLSEVNGNVITMKTKPGMLGEVVVVGYDGRKKSCGGFTMGAAYITRSRKKTQSIDSLAKLTDLKPLSLAFPNPIKRGATLTIRNTDFASYQLSALNGQTLYRGILRKNEKQPLQIAQQLAAGIYVLSLLDDNGRVKHTEKIVVN